MVTASPPTIDKAAYLEMRHATLIEMIRTGQAAEAQDVSVPQNELSTYLLGYQSPLHLRIGDVTVPTYVWTVTRTSWQTLMFTGIVVPEALPSGIDKIYFQVAQEDTYGSHLTESGRWASTIKLMVRFSTTLDGLDPLMPE